MRANGGAGYFVRNVFVKNSESESQEFFHIHNKECHQSGEGGRQSIVFPRPVLPPAVGSCPGSKVESAGPPCSHISAITGPWGGLGLGKLLGVTRVQVVLVPAPQGCALLPFVQDRN